MRIQSRNSSVSAVRLAILIGVTVSLLPESTRGADAEEGSSRADAASEHEPIPYFERYHPSFFLLGKPQAKVQLSFKIQLFRDYPFYFGYIQLLIWDLFGESSPIRDSNYNPEIFRRWRIPSSPRTFIDFGPFEHESNGKDGPDSLSWNRTYLRVLSTREGGGALDRRISWSAKLAFPYGFGGQSSRDLPKYRGIYEFQIAISDWFGGFFDVNELIFRIYPGGNYWINPFLGGQELTYREKLASRTFLLPLYLQIFHGYGENLLDAADSHWGIRAGVGF
jgi:phospholipase A1